jgi:heptosyltransferase-2
VIRGGAIGDFILTLPAIILLRDRFPQAHLEILGAKTIAALAEKRFYAKAISSLDSAALAPFFVEGSALPASLIDYFGSFDLILSYLFDPQQIFERNLKRCGLKIFIAGPPKLDGSEHAARQLARPLQEIGLILTDPAARIYPLESDREFARNFLRGATSVVALHPGSGSGKKNWPIKNWKKLGEYLLSRNRTVVIVAGEADEEQTEFLESAWKGKPVRFARNLPLPHLAALLEKVLFVGHDSGISHLAAAAGARCILLFGPTDPAVWAPANENVSVLKTLDGNLQLIQTDEVIALIDAQELIRIGIST